jgi:hypothetical protein
MDGLSSNGGRGTQQSREPAHSHHRSSGFVVLPYSTPVSVSSNCAAAGSANLLNLSHVQPTYSVSSSSSQSPHLYPAAVANTYSASYPAADYAVPHSSSSTSYHDTTKASAPDPPKKPLSPYMRFSKSVSYPDKGC